MPQNGLLQAPDVASYDTPLVVTILPALPSVWPSGSIKGARIRGGMTLDLEWAQGKLASLNIKVDNSVIARPVEVVYDGNVIWSFTTSSGMSKSVSFS